MSDRRGIEDLTAPGVRARRSVLNRDGLRILEDIDIFHDAIEGVRRGHWPSSPDIAGAMIDPEPRA